MRLKEGREGERGEERWGKGVEEDRMEGREGEGRREVEEGRKEGREEGREGEGRREV